MVYGHVIISKYFSALPLGEEDIQWMKEHRIKAFRAVTTGNYGDVGWIGAGRIGGREGGEEDGKNLKLKCLALLYWTSFIASCVALYLLKKSSHCERSCRTSLFIFFSA